MALSKSKKGFLSISAMPSMFAALALSVLSVCSGKEGSAADSGGEHARVCEPALSDDASVRRLTAAYWVVDRIEDAAAGEGAAVLENSETLLTEERSVKELPAGVVEGQILTDGGVDDWSLRADEALAARLAGISERFERLKAVGGAGAIP